MNRNVGRHSAQLWCGALSCLVTLATVAWSAEPRASLTLSTKISAPPVPLLASDEAEISSTFAPSPLIPEVDPSRQNIRSKPWIMEAHPLPYVEQKTIPVVANHAEPPEPVIPPARHIPPKLTRTTAIVEATREVPTAVPAKAPRPAIENDGKGIPRAFTRTGKMKQSIEPVLADNAEPVKVEVVNDNVSPPIEPSTQVASGSEISPQKNVMLPALAPPHAASLPAGPAGQADEVRPAVAPAPAYAPAPTPLPVGPIVAMAPPPLAPTAVAKNAEPESTRHASESESIPPADPAPSDVIAELKNEAMKTVAVTPVEPIGSRPARLSDQTRATSKPLPSSAERSEMVPAAPPKLIPLAKADPQPTPPPVSEENLGQEAAAAIAAVIPVSAAPTLDYLRVLKPGEVPKEQMLSAPINQVAATSPAVASGGVVNAVAVTSSSSDESQNIQQAGCSSCGNADPLPRPDESGAWSGSSMDDSGGCMTCGAGRGPCTPGQIPCAECDVHTPAGRMMAELYHCICCPDPCYEPRWIALANAAITVDPIRPQTHQTFRWDFMNGLRTPDRAEYYFGRYAAYAGDGPLPPTPPPTSPPYVDTSVEFNELTSYSEAALKKFGIFVEVPYRSIDPNVSNSAAGFSDIKVGTKSVVFDCELMQVAIQFKTYIPSGVSFQGLGTGHTTLEPSVLVGLKLHPDVYFQGQMAEWIPFSADATQAGAILRVNASLNALLWCLNRDVQLIGTLEANTWSFQDGQFINPYLDPSNPATYAINASGQTYGWMGPGARLSICNRIDFGMATMFGFGERSWSDFGLRMEMRTMF